MSIAEIDLGLVHSADALGTGATSATTTSGDVLRECKHRFYHDFNWSVPFPQVPAAPLLFVPTVLKDILDVEGSVMNCELDAMCTGVLDSVPLVHFPIAPGEIRKARAVVKANQEILRDKEMQWTNEGNLKKLAWSATERNPDLDPKDFALIDTDIDAGILEKREMPSLTLLKRPLYTEIGLTSTEDRHLQRLKRLVPPELVQQVVARMDDAQASQLLASLTDLLHQRLPSDPRGPSAVPSSSQPTDESERWRDEVRKSFRYATSVDHEYSTMIDQIACQKLGLGRVTDKNAVFDIAERFWHLLFNRTNGSQQRALWVAVCTFVSMRFGLTTSSANPKAELRQTMQHYAPIASRPAWAEWLLAYLRMLDDVNVIDSTALAITSADCDPGTEVNAGVFIPSIAVRRPIQRSSSRLVDPVDKRTRLPTYPVEVLPIFPSGYQTFTSSAIPGSRGAGLTQLVVQGVKDVLPSDRHCYESHMIVNNDTLLVADQSVTKRVYEENPLEDCSTVHYRTSENLVVKEYLHDSQNTSSLLLEVRDDVCVYDFVPSRREYRRNPAVNPPPMKQYVVVFHEGAVDDAQQERKRPRDE